MTFKDQVAAFERQLIDAALKQSRGNKVQAAKLLGMPRATLASKIVSRFSPDESQEPEWEDAPLMFVVRRVDDRVRLGAAWTRAEVDEAARDPGTLGMFRDEAVGQRVVRDINRALMTRGSRHGERATTTAA